MMPLPNHKAIPDGWSRAHQHTVETSFRSRIDILVPLEDIPPYDPFNPGGYEAQQVAKTGVPARIRALSQETATAQVGQELTTQAYLVQIPAHEFPGLKAGAGDSAHRIRVTGNPNGPDLEGRVLLVMAVRHESEAFTRDLICREHVTQQQG